MGLLEIWGFSDMHNTMLWQPASINRALQIDPASSLMPEDFVGQLEEWSGFGEPEDLLTKNDSRINSFRSIYAAGLQSPHIRPALDEIILPGHDDSHLRFEFARKAALAMKAHLSARPADKTEDSPGWSRLWQPVSNRHKHWGHLQQYPPEARVLFDDRLWQEILGMKDDIILDSPKKNSLDYYLRFTLGKFLFFSLIPGLNRNYGSEFSNLADMMAFLEQEDVEGYYELFKREYLALADYAQMDVDRFLLLPPEEIFHVLQDLAWLVSSVELSWIFHRGHYLSWFGNWLAEEDLGTLRSLSPSFDLYRQNDCQKLLQNLAAIKDFAHFIGYPLSNFFEASGVELIQPLVTLYDKLHKHLEIIRDQDPGVVKRIVQSLQDKDAFLLDSPLDRVFGISIPPLSKYLEEGDNWDEVGQQYGSEAQLQYSGMPYLGARMLVRHLPLSADDVIYELGSGYGRIAFYLAMTTPAFIKGIEVYQRRYEASLETMNRLRLERVEFIHGDATTQDMSDGTVFHLYNSFDPQSLKEVMDNIRSVAKHKKVTVVSGGPSSYYLSTLKTWLRPKVMMSSHESTMQPNKDFFVFESY